MELPEPPARWLRRHGVVRAPVRVQLSSPADADGRGTTAMRQMLLTAIDSPRCARAQQSAESGQLLTGSFGPARQASESGRNTANWRNSAQTGHASKYIIRVIMVYPKDGPLSRYRSITDRPARERPGQHVQSAQTGRKCDYNTTVIMVYRKSPTKVDTDLIRTPIVRFGVSPFEILAQCATCVCEARARPHPSRDNALTCTFCELASS